MRNVALIAVMGVSARLLVDLQFALDMFMFHAIGGGPNGTLDRRALQAAASACAIDIVAGDTRNAPIRLVGIPSPCSAGDIRHSMRLGLVAAIDWLGRTVRGGFKESLCRRTFGDQLRFSTRLSRHLHIIAGMPFSAPSSDFWR